MANFNVWMLEASNITVSGGQSLSGFTQGDGSHLVGETIRLDNNDWLETSISDGGWETNFDDNDGNQRLDGAQTIDGTTYADNTRVEAEYRLTLTDPDTGETWDVLGFNVNNSSPAYGTVEGLAFVGPEGGFPPIGRDLEVTAAYEGPSFGGEPRIDADELASPPCFAEGTRILTPEGPRPVEELAVGDMVITRDDGPQPLRWTGKVEIDAERLRREPACHPVRIAAGAFGPGRPMRDLWLSQQHRVLMTGAHLELHFAHDEMLCAAVHLVGGADISLDMEPRRVVYHHILCDAHQILFAEGLEAESFLPGESGLDGVPRAAREELLAFFPELGREDAAQGPDAARPILRRFEAAVIGLCA